MTLLERINSLNWGGEGYPTYDGEMFIGTALALGLGLAASAAGSIASTAIGSGAASDAAQAQSQAAIQAAQIQADQANKGLDFQKQVFGTQQSELAPYLGVGYSGLANLANLMGTLPSTNIPLTIPGVTGSTTSGFPKGITIGPDGKPINAPNVNTNALPNVNAHNFNDVIGPRGDGGREGGPGEPRPRPNITPTTPPQLTLQGLVNPSLGASGSLAQGFGEKFQAPTAITEQNDPGFQARLNLGQQALERSASAKGGLLTGGEAKDLNSFAQDYASNEYGNVYNRAFNEYANRYNVFNQNQTNLYNRLAAMSGIGQQTASQLGYLGNQAAGNATNILLGSGQQIGNDIQNAGAARASGYVGQANAINGGINSITSGLGNYFLLSQLMGKQPQLPGSV